MLPAPETELVQKPTFWEVGFKDKIQKADFNIEPEHTLSDEELQIGKDFLHFQLLPPKSTRIDAIVGPGTSKSIDLLNYWKRINGLLLWDQKHSETGIVMPSGKRPDQSRATASEMAEGFSEAAIMRDELIGLGMDPKKLGTIEESATHTGENIVNSLDLLFGGMLDTSGEGQINILVATSSYCGKRTEAYLVRELQNRGLQDKVNVFIYDADVQEDIDREKASKAGQTLPPLTPEEEKLKLVTQLREMQRLDRYTSEGQIPRLNTPPVLEER